MSARAVITLTKASKARPLGSIQIQCRVKPGVSQNREGINSISNYAVELNVAAPPRDGEANKAVIKLLSEALRAPKSEFSICAGHKSRDKTVEISPSTLGIRQDVAVELWPNLIREKLALHIADR